MYTAFTFHVTLFSKVTLKSYALLEIGVFEKKIHYHWKHWIHVATLGKLGNARDISLRLKDAFGEQKIMGFERYHHRNHVYLHAVVDCFEVIFLLTYLLTSKSFSFFYTSPFQFPCGDSDGKESTCSAGDPGSILGSGGSAGEVIDNPLLGILTTNILAWSISWTEGPDELQSMGSESWTQLSD